MAWYTDDKTLHAANLLVCAGTLITPAGFIAIGGAAVGAALSLKEIAKRLNDNTRPLAETLNTQLAQAIEDLGHLKGDAKIIISQMIEAALPEAQTIIDTGQQVEPLLGEMLNQLAASDQVEYKLPANTTAFKQVMRPVLQHLLHDPVFTAQLAPLRDQVLLEMRDTLNDVKQTGEKTQASVEQLQASVEQLQATLQDISSASRDQLEALANSFQIDAVFDRSDADLRQLLTHKATEYRALKAQVDAIPDSMKRLSNLKSAAQDAIARVDLDEVENLMTLVHETELDEAAKSAEIRANNALLRGKVDQAYSLLCAAADSFAPIDPLEPARRRILHYFAILWKHGLRYGGAALPAAEQIISPLLTDTLKAADPWLSAAGQNSRANALANQGIRTEGAKGTALLGEAVTAFRAALEIITRADHPLHWAMTQNNLANALRNQGSRTEGAKGTPLLGEAVTTYRAALEVHTRADHPLDWAMTQNNLATALSDQGSRNGGAIGAALLGEAVTAFRAALEVRTRADHPLHWAMTQNNLAAALSDQGSRTEGAKGTALLAEAVTTYRAALEVRTRADHPVQWAITQENIAIAQLEIADHDSCTDPQAALLAARDAVNKALTIFDPDHMSYDHGTATRLRERIQSRLDALGPG
jgi:tetratricopeptide (TPR) repeat protein